jgi:hypothetical protein
MEMTMGSAFLQARGELLDIRTGSDHEVYPFDGRLVLLLGGYVSDGETEILGMPAAAYGGFQVSQPFGDRGWSVGFEGGLELGMEHGYIQTRLELFDVWSGSREEVYESDGRIVICVGGYM